MHHHTDKKAKAFMSRINYSLSHARDIMVDRIQCPCKILEFFYSKELALRPLYHEHMEDQTVGLLDCHSKKIEQQTLSQMTHDMLPKVIINRE